MNYKKLTDEDISSEIIGTDKVIVNVGGQIKQVPVSDLEKFSVALPTDDEGELDYGRAGQVAISDGAGGVIWTNMSGGATPPACTPTVSTIGEPTVEIESTATVNGQMEIESEVSL